MKLPQSIVVAVCLMILTLATARGQEATPEVTQEPGQGFITQTPAFNIPAPIVFVPPAGSFNLPADTTGPFAWCGTILIGRVVIDAPELAMIATRMATPTSHPARDPRMYMQVLYDRNFEDVMIEGCWTEYPSRELVSSLIENASGIGYTWVYEHMELTVFGGPTAVQSMSALEARQYIAAAPELWQPYDLIDPRGLPTVVVDATSTALWAQLLTPTLTPFIPPVPMPPTPTLAPEVTPEVTDQP